MSKAGKHDGLLVEDDRVEIAVPVVTNEVVGGQDGWFQAHSEILLLFQSLIECKCHLSKKISILQFK